MIPEKDDPVASDRKSLGEFIDRIQGQVTDEVFTKSLGFPSRNSLAYLKKGNVSSSTLKGIGKLINMVDKEEEKENLRDIILRLRLGEAASFLLPDKHSISLSKNLAVQELLKAIMVLKEYERRNVTSLVFSMIFGSAISLIQCIEFFAKNPKIQPDAWDQVAVFNDLDKIVETRNVIDWSCSPHFNLWAIGFFLNKAMANIAHLIEQGTTDWLKARGVLSARSKILASQLMDLGNALTQHANPVAADKSINLSKILRQTKTIRTALEQLDQDAVLDIHARLTNTGLCSPEELGDIFKQILVEEEAQIACVAVACVRGHLFEFAAKASTRKGVDFVIEWVAAVRATLWAAEFGRLMLDDMAVKRVAQSSSEEPQSIPENIRATDS